MKKNWKKVISVVSLCTILAGTFTGCGTEQGEMKEAKIWMSVGHSKQFWEQKVEEYNKTKSKASGVKLVLETKTDDAYNQAVDIAIQSNQLPTFYFTGSCDQSVDADVVYPLSDLPGMDEMIDKYASYMQEKIHKLGDDVYALPFGITTRGLIYNKDMFKEAGIVDENGEAKPPKTYDEMREYAKILTNESEQKYGIVFPIKWASWLESDIATMSMAGSGKIRAYDHAEGTYDYSAYEPVLKMIQGIKADGSYYPGAEGLDNDPARARFALGNIGMKISYSFDVGVFNTQFPAEMDWGVAPLPVADVDKCYKQPATVGLTVMVSKTGVEEIGEEAAADIFKFLYSDESVAELYKQGLEMPCIWEIAEGVEPNEGLKGWAEFAQMAEISTVTGNPMPSDTKGAEALGDVIINRIWTNGEDPAPILEERTKIVNEGIKKYQDSHPEMDFSIYLDKDWNEKIRRDSF